MKPTPREHIRDLPMYEPGRPIEEVARELGLDDEDGIINKLASNENALGPSPRAMEAMKAAISRMHLYPDGGSYYLRRALAAKLNVEMDQIIVGNGSNEILFFLAHVYLRKGTHIIMADRAFVIYRLLAAAFEAETTMVPMKEFRHDLDSMADAITPDTRIVFISNPNNPTGTMVSEDAIARFMEKAPEHVVVVLDEAYVELLPPAVQPNTLKYIRERPDVYILRTFSKTYGLAGLRLGYAVAARESIDILHRVRQPFNVNAMAQAAGAAAVEDDEHVEKTRAMVQEGSKLLSREFEELGLEYVPSVTNFMLVKVGEGRRVFEAMQRKRIILRAMDVYRLPEYVRITIGTAEQNIALLRALKECMNEGIIRS